MRHLAAAGIWDDTRNTSGSNANGKWVRRPDGSIEQTGSISATGGAGTITFPLPFPASCDHVALTPVVAGLGTNASANAFLAAAPTKAQAVVVARSLTGLTTSAGAFTILWRATGS